MRRGLSVRGVGVVTDSIGDARELYARIRGGLTTKRGNCRSDPENMTLGGNPGAHPAGENSHDPIRSVALGLGVAPQATAWGERLDSAGVSAQERLAGLVIRAAHEALSMAWRDEGQGGAAARGERLGLVYVSSWGAIDATVAYLESMLEADGRYASPRHFSRSVYSSVASALATWFGIKGPCETLCFPEGGAVAGALIAAWRLLARGRCDAVLVVWAEQAATIAADLANRAARQLHRRQFARYAQGLGEGAVAAVVTQEGTGTGVRIDAASTRVVVPLVGEPFAMDDALRWLAGLMLAGGG